MQWKTILLNQSINIHITPSPPKIPLFLRNEVDFIWDNKKKQFPKLFNGRVFNVASLSPDIISGYWTEYKKVLAQTEKPELYSELAIRSLAVIGLIQCPEGFVLGKRTVKSVYLPGYWQSPPAGTVESRGGNDEVDLIQQLYAEAEEELGLHAHHLMDPKIISATEHTDTHIIDIGILQKTNLSFQEVFDLWRQNNNPEYDELLCCVDYESLPENTLPTTRFLIQNWSE